MSEQSQLEKDAPGVLSQTFAGQPPEEHGSRWMKLWDQNVTPWDRGQPNPALMDLLQEKMDLAGQSWVADPAQEKRRKRALIPGCGRGYDVLLLSAFGYDAYGLDLSESGIKAAKEYEKMHGDDDTYKGRGGIEKGKVTWMVGDFFKDDFIKAIGGDKSFDLLYDYTFLSALPPALRPKWSHRMSELLSPTGVLICGEWPSEKDPGAGGPPWPLPPQVYLNHLSRPGQELPYGEDGKFLEDKLEPVSKDGLERTEHIRPKRTHPAGMTEDGRVHEWISLWKHKSLS